MSTPSAPQAPSHRFFRLAAFLLLALNVSTICARGQEAPPAEEDDKARRVQYQLVLPDEKTPERVKPEENNPFESALEAANRNAPQDTEENRVYDVLAKLPVVGASLKKDGQIKVMLGDIMLEPGMMVPPVFEQQQAQLKVKSITLQFIELAWQDKEATGLPPKVMLIPINISPEVKYKLYGGQGAIGRVTRSGNILKNGQPLAAQPLPDRQAPPASPAAMPGEVPAQQAAPASSAAPGIESAVRMLFGNPVPSPNK